MKQVIHHQIIVIGAGPAGLQLGYSLDRHGIDYLILERESVASFFTKYPRDGQLISFNKKYSIYEDPEVNLRWDWNSLLTEDYDHRFTDYSEKLYPRSSELVGYLRDFAKKFKLNVKEGVNVVSIDKPGDQFDLVAEHGERYTCDYLVVASGLTELYYPDVPGIEHIEETYCNVSIDGSDYCGKRILIIGKGNSGFELADRYLETAALIHLVSPESVTLAWQTRHPGHVRANYARILDSYQLKLLHGALDAHVVSIKRIDGKYEVEVEYVHADSEREVIEYDHVILCAGFKFSAEIFGENTKPELTINNRFPAITSEWESKNVRNMFFCGTLTQSLDFRKASSAFIDGFRYNARSLANILGARTKDKDIIAEVGELKVDDVVDYIEKRVCRTSSLWTQFGSLSDIICYDASNERFVVYQDLPVNYHADFLAEKYHNRSVLTFEWGEFNGDVFNIDRHPSNEMSYTNVFLHPILRTYVGRELMSTHHILEDLFGMYSSATAANTRKRIAGKSVSEYHHMEHHLPLVGYITRVMSTLVTDNAATRDIAAQAA
jgi:thioredoxin reductase